MIRFTERFRSTTLAELRDFHPEAISVLEGYAADPYAKCWLFLGGAGTMKTTAAMALASSIGAGHEWPGITYVNCSETGIDGLKEIYKYLSCSFLCPKHDHAHVCVLEELSKMSRESQEFAKSALENCLPDKAIVIATSNDVSGLQVPLVERFETLSFDSTPVFEEACLKHCMRIWTEMLTNRFGLESPSSDAMRKLADSNGRFSMRTLLGSLEKRYVVMSHQKKVASGVRTDQSEIFNDR